MLIIALYSIAVNVQNSAQIGASNLLTSVDVYDIINIEQVNMRAVARGVPGE